MKLVFDRCHYPHVSTRLYRRRHQRDYGVLEA